MYAYYWQCDYHGAVMVRHYKMDDLNLIGLVFPHNDQLYQATFVSDPSSPKPPSFYIQKLGNKVQDIVCSLDFHPDLNPDNILDKIKTYLVFS